MEIPLTPHIYIYVYDNDANDNKLSLVRIMAWRQTCEKPLSEQMMA